MGFADSSQQHSAGDASGRVAGSLCLGIDLGSSGVRLALLDGAAHCCHGDSTSYPAAFEDGAGWQVAVGAMIKAIPADLRAGVAALAIAGTSGTLLACHPDGGRPLAPAEPYHRAYGERAEQCLVLAGEGSPAASASGALARALELQGRHQHQPLLLRHQAEWLAGWLLDDWRWGDAHNSLKLGWDPLRQDWAGSIGRSALAPCLPRVRPPGTRLGPLHPERARQLGLPRDCKVIAGTTDGNAAVLAVGPQPGDGITVLGSTMVLKQVCPSPIQGPGVYSHPLGAQWICGGASNAGGAVLRRFFDERSLVWLSRQIDPTRPSGLDYLPLPRPGERFPRDDPALQPRLEPRPVSDALFLQGLLEGLAAVEAEGWQRLRDLGAPGIQRVISVGGGARNPQWRQLRQLRLGITVLNRPGRPPAEGAARLAWQGLRSQTAA